MDVVLGVVTSVGGESTLAVQGAAEGSAEVLDQVGHQGVGLGARGTGKGGIGGQAISGVEPVDGAGLAADVGGGQLAAEVRHQVDVNTVDSGGSKDTGDLDH